MATGAEFFAQLEKRFNQLPTEEKLDKIVEYQKKLTALKEQGLSEEEKDTLRRLLLRVADNLSETQEDTE